MEIDDVVAENRRIVHNDHYDDEMRQGSRDNLVAISVIRDKEE